MKTTRARRRLRVGEVVSKIETFAPLALAEDFDRVGLAIGSRTAAVRAVVLSLEADPPAVEEAHARGAGLVVCHHPPTLRDRASVDLDTPYGRVVASAIRRRVAVYCAHTNLDSALGGTNDVLCRLIGIDGAAPLVPKSVADLRKLVVFVPPENLDAVFRAITRAGAGVIGEYDHCTWRCLGTGTFRGSDATHPAIGEPGKDQEVTEFRLESVVPEARVGQVIEALRTAHVYEEVAVDVYPVKAVEPKAGAGRIGVLARPLSLGALSTRIKQALRIKRVRVTRSKRGPVRRVAVCTGSGASLLSAAASAGADVFVTGEVKYHGALAAKEAALSVIEAGHYATEQPVLATLRARLTEAFPDLDVSVFKGGGEPQEIV